MEPVQYDEFLLNVRNDRHIEGILNSANGATDNAPGTLNLDETVEKFLNYLIRLIGRGNLDEEGLQLLGDTLYKLLFPDRVGSLFEKALDALSSRKNARLRVCINGEQRIARWPLEFLRCRGIFLATDNSRMTLFRRLNLASSYQPQLHGLPLKVLIVVSKPANLGGVMTLAIEDIARWAAAEMKGDVPAGVTGEPRIDVTLLGLVEEFEKSPGGVRYLNRPATLDNLRDVYSEFRPDILHFIGHGKSEEDKSFLALVADETSELDWCDDVQVLQVFSAGPPTLVVLQACQSAKEGTGCGFTSMAARLVQQNVAAVVAMQFDLRNDCAIEFAAGFYRALAEGLDIDAAVQKGRSMIPYSSSLKVRWRERHFGAPVLFMLKAGRIILPAIRDTRLVPARQLDTAARPHPGQQISETSRPAENQDLSTEAQLRALARELLEKGDYKSAGTALQALSGIKAQSLSDRPEARPPLAGEPCVVEFPHVATGGGDGH